MKIRLLVYQGTIIEVRLGKTKDGCYLCGTRIWAGRNLAISVGEDCTEVFNRSINRLIIEEQI